MSRNSIIDIIYTKNKSPLEFSFDTLTARPLFSLLTPDDVYQLNKIATSIRLSSKPKQKYAMIENILVPRGFKKIASGTNRVAYKYLEDQSIIIKVAIDKVGLSDNPREYYNQFLLKPFVTKVFEVTPCGTVGLFERVVPITSREEYLSVAEDVFNMITTQIIGKYVVDDIGTTYFQNIGVRPGMGVVLLDFPYVYELDGNKLFCNKKDITGHICEGEIDYDSGFNKLICTKCGKQYYARQLKKYESEKKIQVKREGDISMAIVVKRGNEILHKSNGAKSADVLPRKNTKIDLDNIIEETTTPVEESEKVTNGRVTIVRPGVKKSDEAKSEPVVEETKKIEPKEVVVKKEYSSPIIEEVIKEPEPVNEEENNYTNNYNKVDERPQVDDHVEVGGCNPNISVEDYKVAINKALKLYENTEEQEPDSSETTEEQDIVDMY